MGSLLDAIKISLQSGNLGNVKIQYITWGIFAGVAIAVLMIFYYKKIFGSFVRSLMICEAFSPESARSIEEIGQADNHFVTQNLAKGKGVAKIIEKTEENGVAKYYIPEKQRERAIKQYSDNTSTVWTVIISILIFAVFAFIAFFAVPVIAKLLTNTFFK